MIPVESEAAGTDAQQLLLLLCTANPHGGAGGCWALISGVVTAAHCGGLSVCRRPRLWLLQPHRHGRPWPQHTFQKFSSPQRGWLHVLGISVVPRSPQWKGVVKTAAVD